MTFNGEWKPTLPFPAKTTVRWQFFGIFFLTIDGREIKCGLYANKGQTFARVLDNDKWFQLAK